MAEEATKGDWFARGGSLMCPDARSFSDEDGVNNLKHMMQRAEIGLLPLAARASADGPPDAASGAAGLGLKVRRGAGYAKALAVPPASCRARVFLTALNTRMFFTLIYSSSPELPLCHIRCCR